MNKIKNETGVKLKRRKQLAIEKAFIEAISLFFLLIFIQQN